MNSVAERSYLSIGQVVNLLRGSYPDLSNSKIRFLEDEGLISPHRTPKGYRQYSKEDVDRLEVILHLQKTRYMPLNVIKQRLESATDLNTLAYEVGLLSDVPLKAEPKETKQKLHPIEDIPDLLGVNISFVRQLAETKGLAVAYEPDLGRVASGCAGVPFLVSDEHGVVGSLPSASRAVSDACGAQEGVLAAEVSSCRPVDADASEDMGPHGDASSDTAYIAFFGDAFETLRDRAC